MANILVIDDDTNILEVIQTRLEANGYYVETYANPLEALECVKEKTFDVIITDVRMPHIDGMELLRRVRNLHCDVPVILLTAYGTIPSAVEAMKQGAFQYLTKPFQGKHLVEEIENALAEQGRSHRVPPSENEMYFPGVYGVSPRMKDLYPKLERIVESESTVLVQGESGTGKELVAQMIHYNGTRKENRFVIMDCGATPASLIESELFGHTRGSFTNAMESRKGMFELAHNGTLFLDEISSLPLDLQTRLLRVLQEGQFKRVGENQMQSGDVRIIAATNLDLREQVEKGLFRLDLYYRLAVLKVELPRLQERKEDIPLLADFFLKNFAKKMRKEPMEWEDGAKEVLRTYHWPGNIRELKNVIEAGVVFSKGKVLSLDDLRSAGFKRGRTPEAPPPVLPEDLGGLSLPESLEQQEKGLILKALEQNNWIQKDAALQLGISPRVLCYKIKKLKLDPAADIAEP